MFRVAPEYPGDAVGGCDFFTHASRRTIFDTLEDGTIVERPELVLVSDMEFDHFAYKPYGRVCLSEQTVRQMGQLVGLVDESTLNRVVLQRDEALRQIQALVDENAALRRLGEALNDVADRIDPALVEDGNPTGFVDVTEPEYAA